MDMTGNFGDGIFEMTNKQYNTQLKLQRALLKAIQDAFAKGDDEKAKELVGELEDIITSAIED